MVDVAGGKGELAFELMNLNGISTTVVDPRHTEFTRCLKKLRHGFYTRNPLYSKYISVKEKDCSNKPLLPNHIKMFLNRKTIEWFSLYDRSKNTEGKNSLCLERSKEYFREGLDSANNKILVGESSKFQEYRRGVSKDKMRLIDYDDAGDAFGRLKAEKKIICSHEIKSESEAYEILKHSSLLVGLHPDQATEFIVDFALQNKKKFAVIPCCVCSKDFPNRFDKSTGNVIKSYNEFIKYLRSKDDSIKQSEILGLSGRNIVLHN